MKIFHNDKLYDSTKCKKIAEYDTLIIVQNTNGQDCHINDCIYVINLDEAKIWLEENNPQMDEDQEKLAVEKQLIEIIN